MERKICVSLDFLEEKHRDAIEKTAAETNFVPRFFSKRERDAATAWLQESEILNTGSLTLPAKAGASLRRGGPLLPPGRPPGREGLPPHQLQHL